LSPSFWPIPFQAASVLAAFSRTSFSSSVPRPAMLVSEISIKIILTDFLGFVQHYLEEMAQTFDARFFKVGSALQ
jgi:hypothetical protein